MISKIRKIIYGKEYKDKLDEKILNNKILWLMIMIMFVWNNSLTLGYINLKENNTVKADFPPINYTKGTQVVGNDFANDEYFLAWGMFHIINSSNFDTQNINEKIDAVANMMLYDRYIELKNGLDKFVANVKKNKLKSTFSSYNDTWDVVSRGKNKYGSEVATVVVEGEVLNTYSTFKPKRQKCSYSIGLFRKGGKTYVQDFSSTCF